MIENIVKHLHPIIKDLIIPLDVGLLVLFSLITVFLQIFISTSILKQNRQSKDIKEIFEPVIESIHKGCDALIKKINKIWLKTLLSIIIVFFYYLFRFFLEVSSIEISRIIVCFLLTIIVIFLFIFNLHLVWSVLRINIIGMYLDIKRDIDSYRKRELRKIKRLGGPTKIEREIDLLRRVLSSGRK